MTRGTDPTLAAELQQPQVQIANLVEIRLDAADGGTQYHTDAPQDVSWNGNTYQRGRLLSVTVPDETTEVKTTNADIIITAVDQAEIQTLLGSSWIYRDVFIFRCALKNGALVGQPLIQFMGSLSDGALSENMDSGTSTVTWRADSQLSIFSRKNGRRTVNESQQTLFPGDRFFEFSQQVDIRVPWGVKK